MSTSETFTSQSPINSESQFIGDSSSEDTIVTQSKIRICLIKLERL